MKKLILAIAAGLAMVTGAAFAHGPSRLKTEQSVLLDAPTAEVWAVVGNFSDMSWFPGAGTITATGEEKGATRIRVTESGQEVKEELLKRDPAKFAISTRFTENNIEAVNATNYASHITLKDEGGKTRLEWRGAFYRADPNNDPPAALNDDAAISAVEALHQQALDALAARFGAAH